MNNIKDGRRHIVFGVAAVATVLALSSVAMACTTFRGTLQITGNAPGSGTSKTLGKNAGMQHCDRTPTGFAQATKTAGSVTVAVSPVSSADQTTYNCPASQLPANTYNVLYHNGAGFSGDLPTSYRNWLVDCMSEGPGIKKIGTMAVGGTGNGSGTYSLGNSAVTNDPAVNESAICVSDATAAYGNQGPVTIVLP